MTRIGKKPILIDPEIKISQSEGKIFVEGPQGKLELSVPDILELNTSANSIEISLKKGQNGRDIHGLFRSLLQNAVSGVKTSWTKTLELVGVGFRAQSNGSELELNVGFSHPVKIPAPKGISFKVVENKITVIGPDKYLVGEVAASVRRVKPPEPYKGKGIRYDKEVIRKKLGKAAKAVGGAGAK